MRQKTKQRDPADHNVAGVTPDQGLLFRSLCMGKGPLNPTTHYDFMALDEMLLDKLICINFH